MSFRVKEKGRLLAINFGGIGDEILFQPTLKTIRETLPDWSITLMLEPRSASFGDLTDLIDNTITFDIKKRPLLTSDLMDLLFTIRNGGFDMVLSSGSSPMVSALLYLSGVPVRIGYASNMLSQLTLNKACPLNQSIYAGQMYHSLANGLKELVKTESTFAGTTNGGGSSLNENSETLYLPKIKTESASREAMAKVLARAGLDDRLEAKASRKNFVVLVHPGTSRLAQEKGIYKTWPAENWSLLAERILKEKTAGNGKEIKLVLCGGPDDKEIIEAIETKMNNLQVVSTYGQTKSLMDLAALIELSDLFICVDSAPMHVAVGLGSELVALFGPTNPALLLPQAPEFAYVWDNKDNDRSMFDRKGVNLDPDIVFDTVKKKLS